MSRFDVVIVGSGFGGSILARALNRGGLRVALVERDRHPRFALGESSTPLAALSLERLAVEYRLPDLHDLAAHGRWRRRLAALGCGLKRGFTFVDHQGGAPRERRRSCLLVAASPDAATADCHWLRADVDQHLVERASAEGVDYRERCEVVDLTIESRRVDLALRDGKGRSDHLTASFLVDATGAGGLVSRHLGIAQGPELETASHLLFGHFRSVAPWSDGACPNPPYPPQSAAVHHLLDEGWIYELRFDDGRVSAGALLREMPQGPAAEAWSRILARNPALAQAYAAAEPLFPIAGMGRLQRCLARATGNCWAALPHTFGFVDPLFSTGIAWTLRGVERLAQTLTRAASPELRSSDLDRYDRLLRREVRQIDALVAGAYAAMPHFELFSAYAMSYFAAVSWAEVGQRLLSPLEPMWESFLGGDDPELASLFVEARDALPQAPLGASPGTTEAYWRWILERIAGRDIAGLDRYGPDLSVPVDLEILVERADRLGLDRAEMTRRLPLLRGEPEPRRRNPAAG